MYIGMLAYALWKGVNVPDDFLNRYAEFVWGGGGLGLVLFFTLIFSLYAFRLWRTHRRQLQQEFQPTVERPDVPAISG